MKRMNLIGAGGLATLGLLAAPCAYSDPLALPSMGPTINANPNPIVLDAGPVGKIDVGGVASGFAMAQTNSGIGDKDGRLDLTNAQLIIQKADGHFQFYTQLGAYSLPTVAANYYSSSYTTAHQFGVAPVAFIKWAPNAAFNIQAGKMPAIIGMESVFTFQNFNIQRGLLWYQEPIIGQGVQVNYTKGKWALSGAYTDGWYSNTYNWLSGQVVYTINPRDSITINGGASLSRNGKSTFAVPLAQNNEAIVVAGFTHAQGPFAISPYIQYSHIYSDYTIGLPNSASTFGIAVLGKYALTPKFSLAGRVEYIDSSGGDPADPNATNALYGAKSSAWSLTFTPTYQFKIFYLRGEVSYTGIDGRVPGFGFGKDGYATDQTRVMVETGVVF
jgi:hypothetical protein